MGMGVRRRLRIFFQSRAFVLALLAVAQLALMIWIVLQAKAYGHFIAEGLYVISIFMALWILSRDMHPTYKLAWVVPILTVPLFGGLFFILFGAHGFRRQKLSQKIAPYLEDASYSFQDPQAFHELELSDKDAALQARFMRQVSGAKVYSHTQTRYFPCGEDFFDQLKRDLAQAKKFIFLEFFIVDEGSMLNELLDILKLKAAEGVEVRLLYDDVGSAAKLPRNFPIILKNAGIQCLPFNARGLKLSFILNNRDHRKIVIIDGRIAFTGGVNIADEYINKINPFGHWKDSAIRLEGSASESFIPMFLQMWEFSAQKKEGNSESYYDQSTDSLAQEDDGFVIPYADSSPITHVPVSKHAFLNLIQDAKRSIYITTPYLIVDSEIQTALCISALMGIDVRIITPAIPDKKLVFQVTRANYLALLKAGVKIYEYSPGFIHSKTMVIDNKCAVVGTCNFDYRSFFLHFECGVLMYGSRAVRELHDDIIQTCEISQEIALDDQLKLPVRQRILRSVLSAFAPLL